jgi:hypothetical protein
VISRQQRRRRVMSKPTTRQLGGAPPPHRTTRLRQPPAITRQVPCHRCLLVPSPQETSLSCHRLSLARGAPAGQHPITSAQRTWPFCCCGWRAISRPCSVAVEQTRRSKNTIGQASKTKRQRRRQQARAADAGIDFPRRLSGGQSGSDVVLCQQRANTDQTRACLRVTRYA